jgi:hypothetical protein
MSVTTSCRECGLYARTPHPHAHTLTLLAICGLIVSAFSLLWAEIVPTRDYRLALAGYTGETAAPPPVYAVPKPASWPRCMPPDRQHFGDPLRVMCMGDSITFGNGNKTRAFGGYREPLRRLSARPIVFVGKQRCGYPAVAPNEGYPGWSLGEVARIAETEAAIYHPDAILFMAGVNDFNPSHNESLPVALRHEADCVRALSMGCPSAVIYVATLTPIRKNPFMSPSRPAALSAEIPGLVARLQRQGIKCRLVNMAKEVALLHGEYDAYNIHPSDSGCVKEASVWAQALDEPLPSSRRLRP